MSQVVLFNIFNGLIVGAFYALMALGLSLILNLSGVINFAHGGFLALGAYLAYTLIPYVGFWGALVFAPLLTAALGLIVERVLIRPLYGGDPLYSLLLTFGLAYIFEDVHADNMGRAKPAVPGSGLVDDVALERLFLPHRLSRLHDDDRRGGGRRAVRDPQLHAARDPHPRRHARSRTVATLGVNVRVLRSLNFGIGIYIAGLAGVLAAGLLGLTPTIGANADHAELCRDHRRRTGKPGRDVAGRPPDRRRVRRHRGLFPVGDRSGDLCDDGAGAAHTPARAARRGRESALNAARQRWLDVVVWAALITMPYWMGAVGGYTELATRVVVIGLAAMALNFLLGFTGVLSFGHAAYFGLGAYGAAMAIRYLVLGTMLRDRARRRRRRLSPPRRSAL